MVAPARRGLAPAAAAIAVAGLVAGFVTTGSLRIDGTTGDWRAASEGLYRSGQPGVLGAGRRAVIHFHGLDGRAAVAEVTAAARPASPTVRLVLSAGGAPVEAVVGVAPSLVRVPIPRGTRDVDLHIEASALFRVSRLALVRSRDATTAAATVLPAIVGVLALLVTWSRVPRWTAVTWALLAAFGAAALWTFAADPAAATRFAPTVRMPLRIAMVAALWVAALAVARSRVATVVAIVGTVAILHLPTVWYGFYQDDFPLARGWSAQDVAAALHGEFDRSGMVPAYYRPMLTLSWALDHALWGAWTAGYHATNVGLHAAAGVLLVALLRRARLPPGAALLGALAWVSHPVAASTVTWVSARGDSLMAVFYLAALVSLSGPGPSSVRSYATLGVLSALALATKEMAASLPLTALLLDRALLDPEERPARRGRLRLIAALTAAYLALWVSVFAGKVAVQASGGLRWAGFEARDPGHWIRLLPGLYAPLFLPTEYERWWLTPLEGWPWPYLIAALTVVLVAWWVARGTPLGRRAATVGVIWPLLTVLPLLGLASTLDLYRLGYLVVVAVAFVVAGVAMRLARWPPAVAAFAVVLAAALSPTSIDAARAWAPDGFRGRTFLRWKAAEPTWREQLTPEMRLLFEETVAWRCHVVRWADPDNACP